jgi:AraC-like DNA-binding protein
MPLSFSELLLSLPGDAALAGFAGFDPDEVRLRFARSRRTCFHLILEGKVTITMHEDGATRRLCAGDLALCVYGSGHDLGRPVADPRTLPEAFHYRTDQPTEWMTGNPTMRMLTGYLGLEDMGESVGTTGFSPLLVKSFTGHPALNGPFGEQGLSNLLELCRAPGGYAIASAMVRVLHLITMREALQRVLGADPSNLRKLGISQIGAARRLIHADPGRAWTLDDLAQSAGMSRSVFARKFHAVIGETPHRYLSAIRLEEARRLIGAGASVAEASHQVGYASPLRLPAHFANVSASCHDMALPSRHADKNSSQQGILAGARGCFGQGGPEILILPLGAMNFSNSIFPESADIAIEQARQTCVIGHIGNRSSGKSVRDIPSAAPARGSTESGQSRCTIGTL